LGHIGLEPRCSRFFFDFEKVRESSAGRNEI
jgi:hypothetical protein